MALAVGSAWRAEARDWPRFRGPSGEGVAPEQSLCPLTWSPSENLAWSVLLPGPGSSSPIIVGERVFVTCWSGYGLVRDAPGDQSQLVRHLVCIDRRSGKIEWDRTVPAVLPEDNYGGMFAEHGYASHTPVSDGERVYAFFGKTGVVAFDLQGKQLWKQSVGTESGAMDWGSASSPILHKDLLIVPATAESEALVALNKQTGDEVWRQEASGFSGVWGTPVLCPVDESRTDLVIAVPNEVWGFDPESGALRWFCRSMANNSMCSSAVVHDGVVYAIESGPGGGGGIAVRAGGQGDVTETHVVWTGRQQGRIATPVIHDGRLYTFGGGMALCFDAINGGDRVYRARLRGGSGNSGNGGAASGGFGGGGGRGQDYASPVLVGDFLYYQARSGNVYVIQAADKYLQLGVNRVTDETEDFSATPAVADGQLFLRSSKRLYCVQNQSGEPDAEHLASAVAAAQTAAQDAPADDPIDEEPEGRGRGFGGGQGGGRGAFDPVAIFKTRDANGDGKIAGDEFDGPLRDRLVQADADGDGFVTQDEFSEGMRQMFRGGGGGGGRSGRGGRGGANTAPPKPERPQRPPVG